MLINIGSTKTTAVPKGQTQSAANSPSKIPPAYALASPLTPVTPISYPIRSTGYIYPKIKDLFAEIIMSQVVNGDFSVFRGKNRSESLTELTKPNIIEYLAHKLWEKICICITGNLKEELSSAQISEGLREAIYAMVTDNFMQIGTRASAPYYQLDKPQAADQEISKLRCNKAIIELNQLLEHEGIQGIKIAKFELTAADIWLPPPSMPNIEMPSDEQNEQLNQARKNRQQTRLGKNERLKAKQKKEREAEERKETRIKILQRPQNIAAPSSSAVSPVISTKKKKSKPVDASNSKGKTAKNKRKDDDDMDFLAALIAKNEAIIKQKELEEAQKAQAEQKANEVKKIQLRQDIETCIEPMRIGYKKTHHILLDPIIEVVIVNKAVQSFKASEIIEEKFKESDPYTALAIFISKPSNKSQSIILPLLIHAHKRAYPNEEITLASLRDLNDDIFESSPNHPMKEEVYEIINKCDHHRYADCRDFYNHLTLGQISAEFEAGIKLFNTNTSTFCQMFDITKESLYKLILGGTSISISITGYLDNNVHDVNVLENIKTALNKIQSRYSSFFTENKLFRQRGSFFAYQAENAQNRIDEMMKEMKDMLAEMQDIVSIIYSLFKRLSIPPTSDMGLILSALKEILAMTGFFHYKALYKCAALTNGILYKDLLLGILNYTSDSKAIDILAQKLYKLKDKSSLSDTDKGILMQVIGIIYPQDFINSQDPVIKAKFNTLFNNLCNDIETKNI